MCRQIFDLKVELDNARKETQEYKSKYFICKQELDWTKEIIKKYISDDQWTFMAGKKVNRWNDKCIQKAIVLKQIGGERLISFCRNYLIPVPSCRSLYEIMQNLRYDPGIIYFNVNLLKYITENFTGVELLADIKIDEKSITPGRTYDASSCSFVGNTTMPISSRVATNAFAVLLTMMKIRVKILVGYHFMDNEHDVKATHNFLNKLICEVEGSTNVKISSISMDMSPSNISLVNSMGIKLTKYSRDFSVTHPMDSSRRLYIIFDAVHNLKNLVNGLRNHRITIDKDLISKHNLDSKYADLKDVKKLFNRQKDMIYKPCKKLKYEVLNPTHYERMRESIAYDLIDEDVSNALNFMQSANNFVGVSADNNSPKISATSWILRIFNRYSNLMIKTTWTKNNFDENASWLINQAVPIFESLKFENAYLRCTTGAVIGIFSTVELIRQFLNEGMIEFKPEWLSNNSIENMFSQIVKFSPKPTALGFIRAAKSLALSKFMHDALENTNYTWSVSNVSICSEVLKVLRKRPKNSSPSRNELQNSDDYIDIETPERISWQALFSTKLEFNSFMVAMNNLVEKFLQKIHCDQCKSRFMIYSSCPTESNILNRMKTASPWEISNEVQCFLLSLEFMYRQLNCVISCLDSSFNKQFINMAMIQIEVDFEHCPETIDKLLRAFVEFRGKLQNQCRLIHKRNEFASKKN